MGSNWFNYTIIALGVAILVVAVAATQKENYSLTQAEEQLERYCNMVERWQESNGEYGWPDFHGTYDEECLPSTE